MPSLFWQPLRAALVLVVVCILPVAAQAQLGKFEYGERLTGDIEQIGPITFGNGQVEAAAMFNMTKPYVDDEPYLKRGTEVACEVLGATLVEHVKNVRPGDYSLLVIMFKWVGEEVDGVAPTTNYTSVFDMPSCTHVGANK